MGDLKGSPPILHSYEDRLRTFVNWPSTAPVERESLARAGFIYEESEGKVRCFVCHVRCENWGYGDTAIRKHKELQPNCPFVREHTDVLSDGLSMIVDPQMELPSPLSVLNGPSTEADHGRGQGRDTKKPLSPTAPDFHRQWSNYESMNKESERTKTYSNWPVPFLRPEDMARAGFVYLKQGDRVQCVYCYGIVADWEPNDNPFQDHLKHFPRCPFIRGEKCNNISIEDELRGVITTPLQLPTRGVDECGHERRIDVQSFQPERPSELYSKPLHDHSLHHFNVIAHQPSKYPAFATREARKESYNKWPSDIPQTIGSLVDAGFFYTGLTDSVKCFQCGGGLKNWEASDVPWEEHARWFPDCQYVALNKGREYVELSKKNKPPNQQNNFEPTPAEQLPSTSETTWTISEAELETLMNEEIVKKLLSMEFDRNKVKRVLEKRMRTSGYQFPDLESLLIATLEMPDEDSEETEIPQGEKSKCTSSNENNGGNAEKTVQKLNTTTSTGGENRDDLRLCKVCMDRDMNIVFLPCGHFVACVDCASVMDNCPLCREKIKGNVRTYWP